MPPQLRSYWNGKLQRGHARIYTDLSLFTANPEVTRAVHDVFSFLTPRMRKIRATNLCWWRLSIWREKCIALIEREVDHPAVAMRPVITRK